MRNIYLLLFIAVGNVLFSQKANDFTVKDIKGIEYNLFEILSTNRHVLLDVSATWCGPCWSFKKTGVMESYMSKYGPEGTDDAMVFFVEGDATTNMQDLLGQTSASQGNWVEGTNFPIIDNAAVGTLFGVTAFPTIMVVCPDRTIKKVGSRTLTGIENEAKTCGKISGASEPDFRSDLRDGCGLLDVQFFDNSWPRPTNYLWDFGDGTTSTEKNPSHNYNQNGVYSVKLNVRNEFGENTLTKNDFISIGSGFEKPVQSLGPIDHKFATGRYFEGGHHSLIIDAHKPFILHSAKVYSNRDMDRIFTLVNNNGEIVNTKTIRIPEGEHRINLDFYFPEGKDYKLGMNSDAYLYRNDKNANYPYVIDSVLTIKESTAAPNNPGYYYYYYDMEIREVGCTDINSIDENSLSVFSLAPNPANENIIVSNFGKDQAQLLIVNHLGQVVQNNSLIPDIENVIPIHTLLPGLYFAKLSIGNKIITQKFVKI